MEEININLDSFKNHSNLIKASVEFFEQLNIYVTPVTEQIPVPVLELFESQSIQNQRLTDFFKVDGKSLNTFFVGTLNDRSLYQSDEHGQATLADEMQNAKDSSSQIAPIYTSMMIFAVEVDPFKSLSKNEISIVCRAFNRVFANGNPVVVLFRHGDKLTFSLCERTPYRRTTFQGQKAGKVSMLRNISIQKPHSGHIRILWKIQKYKERSKNKVISFNDLYLYWLNEVFAVNVLTDDFYREILNWYLWATGTFNTDGSETDNIRAEVPEMKFPDVNYDIYTQPTEEGRLEVKRQCTHVIRLITRLIFVWFIKQKGLIDDNLFDKEYLKNTIRDFNPTPGDFDNKNYYPAILQNLFFASLNCKSDERGWAVKGKSANSGNSGFTKDYGNDVKYKDDSQKSFYINDSKSQIESLFNQIPYLNGGLFDCLDYLYDPLDDPLHKIKNARKGKKIYVDGFSQEKTRRTTVPDTFFFGYTDSTHKGIIDQIFDKYYFTIEENSTNIIDVALDPELLGHVFEELLSVYNPETGVTMRKATGSFYTPKEIVEYMVTQSVAQYLASKISDVPAADFLRLIEDEEISESVDSHRKEIVEAVIRCKIFDPACGSGAFPMGCLHVLNNIVSILDDNKNTFWKEIVINQTKEAHIKQAERFEKTFNQTEFEEAEKQITENFTNNLKYPNYLRKLYILEHCIYGSDIQRIAMQITKLRFFISLVVEQRDNDNIQTLPNLETKFTCANTLIDNPDPTKNANNFDDAFNKEFKQLISNLANQLKDHRSKIFNTPDRKKKLKLKEQDSILRNSIADETKKKIDQYRNSKIEKCKQEIANAQKAIDDLLAQPDDTRTEVYVEYNIFGDKEEKKRKISKRKDEIEKFRRIKADWERKLQLFADGGQFQPYQTYAERLCEWNPYDMSADNCSFFDAEWMFGIKDGFDVVIGNPPYVDVKTLPNADVKKYFQLFTTTENRINLYAIFIEKCDSLLATNGVLCFINPNSMLVNESYKKLRKHIVNKVTQIIKLPDNVFLSATVETIILILKNSFIPIAKGVYFKNSDSIDFTLLKLKDFDKQIWLNDADCRFNIFIDEKILSIINHIEKNKSKLEDYVLTSLGITPYDKMKGHNEDTIKNRRFHSKTKDGNEYVPLISGKNIHNYFVTSEVDEYLKYGDWLGAPREERFFTEPKIIVRQILGNGQRIIAAYSETQHYFTQIGFSLISKNRNKEELKYLCAILNSKVCSFYHLNKFLDKEKTTFQKILIANARKFPIPTATTAQQQPIIDLVDEILTKKKQNSSEDTTDLEGKIDKLVYELYGLTDEEIAIVEGRE